MPSREYVTYCGLPPTPDALLYRWNFNPALAADLLAVLVLYVWWARRRGLTSATRGMFFTGWAVSAFALMSPLCALSVSLFSARVAQHMILVMASAPLLAMGMRVPVSTPTWIRDPRCAASVLALAMWFWHAPGPYAASFTNDAIYWAMHLSLLSAAIWTWATIISAPVITALISTLISMAQMSLLGALLTFAPRPLYEAHLATTTAWGLSPLGDQQLGGLIMWVPGALPFLLAAVLLMSRAMAEEPQRRPA